MQAVSGRSDGVLSTPTTTSRSWSRSPTDDAPDVLAAIGGRPLVVVVHDSVEVGPAAEAGAAPPRADRLMALQVFTAVTGAAWESELVGALDRADHGVTVVRRCVDVSELLAAAATGTGQAALLSAELRRLDADAVARLEAAGRRRRRSGRARATSGRPSGCASSGVARVLPADAEPGGDRRRAARGRGRRRRCPGGTSPIRAARCRPSAPRSSPEERPGRSRPRRRGVGPDRRARTDDGRGGDRRRGRPARGVDACWSTPTSTAASSRRCWGCSTSRPGWPARRARPAAGDARRRRRWCGWPGRCARTCGCSPAWRGPTAGPSCGRAPSRRCWRRPGGWPTSPSSTARFCLEDDEELSFDTAAPRRNGATLAVLEEADTVLCVSGADPVALQRSIRALGELRERAAGRRAGAWWSTRCAAARCRATRGRRSPAALARFAGRDVRVLPARRPAGHRRGPGRAAARSPRSRRARRCGSALRALAAQRRGGARAGGRPAARAGGPGRRMSRRGAGRRAPRAVA